MICWNFSKQEADTLFLDREKRRKFVARYTTQAADAVTDMGGKNKKHIPSQKTKVRTEMS
jgi:hypothetical protein